MSNSILLHTQNIRGVDYTATRYKGNTIIFEAVMNTEGHKCPSCKHRHHIKRGYKNRQFKLSPVGRKQCVLDLKIHRLECNQCGKLWWPREQFMIGEHRYSRSFALTALDLLKDMTIMAVACFLGVSWDTIKDIHKSNLRILYRRIPLKKVKYAGVDEIYLGGKEKYLTIFTDLESGRILHAVKGRSKDDIAPFLKKLSKKAKKLKAVSMDMSPSYISAVTKYLPGVDIVFDHFHVVKLMNGALDEFRRQLQNELEATGKKTLKGSRYLLLSNYTGLDADKKERLDALLQINQPLFLVHSMKEQLRLFWRQDCPETAKSFLDIWITDAMNSEVKMLARVAKTLAGYREGLLSYYKHFISSGFVEGINNKIKTLLRKSYGFRDAEYFKLRLYHLHNQKYSLSG